MSGQKICQISPIGLIFMNKSINQHGLKPWMDKKSEWAKSRAINEAVALIETVLKTDIKEVVPATQVRQAIENSGSGGKVNIDLTFE
jgi:hypothetical protein